MEIWLVSVNNNCWLILKLSIFNDFEIIFLRNKVKNGYDFPLFMQKSLKFSS